MSDREWITDRLPTAADADKDGDVKVQDRPEAVPSGRFYFHWSMVLPGMAWCHTDIWEQENEPVPAPKPALAVGQRWRRRDGEVVTITEHDVHPMADFPFFAGGHWYRADGTSCIDDSDADLVELIEPAAEPEPAAAEIPEPIRTGASPFFVLVVGDDSGGKVDGTPIVWETQIPAGSSLQSVLQQRQRVGSRYGTTYVAECRIIPELTNEVTREVPF